MILAPELRVIPYACHCRSVISMFCLDSINTNVRLLINIAYQVADKTTPLPRSSACMRAHWNPTQAEMILDNGTNDANPGIPVTAPLRNPKKI